MRKVDVKDVAYKKVHMAYGYALFVIISELSEKEQEEVRQDLMLLINAMESLDEESKVYVPGRTEEDHDIMQALHSAVATQVMRAWIHMVVHSGRLHALLEALYVCKRCLKHGNEPLVVETAYDINSDDLDEIVAMGEKTLGDSSAVKHVVEPSLLAGARIRKGWKEVDMSLRSYILQAKEELY